MYEFNVDAIKVKSNEEINVEEARAYISHVKDKNPSRRIEELSLSFSNEDVEIEYALAPVHFEKIRRITGYLVGDMTRWNDAKTGEERDRIKHA